MSNGISVERNIIYDVKFYVHSSTCKTNVCRKGIPNNFTCKEIQKLVRNNR